MIQKDEMTIQEALEILKPFKACMFDQYGCPISDAAIALDVVIDVIEKQVPMKPYRNIVHYPYRSDMEVVQCPRCKRRLRTNRMTKNGDAYCPDCGQAIDWDPEEPRLQSDTILTEEVRDASDK